MIMISPVCAPESKEKEKSKKKQMSVESTILKN